MRFYFPLLISIIMKKFLLVNIANGKQASQSSNWMDRVGKYRVAKNGNDGLLTTSAITEGSDIPWWYVDLLDINKIAYMILNARQTSNIHNKQLMIKTRKNETEAWKTCKDIGDIVIVGNHNFTCDHVATSARYVEIQATKQCHLYIFELEVYTDP